MNRRLARELCMKMLFEMSIQKEYSLRVFENYFSEDEIETSQKDYIYSIVKPAAEKLDEIDQVITEYAKGWTLDRMSKVDLAIIRLAIIEILYLDDIPNNVAINEAVELAKKYSDDESPSFVNGILGKFIEETGRQEK